MSDLKPVLNIFPMPLFLPSNMTLLIVQIRNPMVFLFNKKHFQYGNFQNYIKVERCTPMCPWLSFTRVPFWFHLPSSYHFFSEIFKNKSETFCLNFKVSLTNQILNTQNITLPQNLRFCFSQKCPLSVS